MTIQIEIKNIEQDSKFAVFQKNILFVTEYDPQSTTIDPYECVHEIRPGESRTLSVHDRHYLTFSNKRLPG